MKAKRGTYTAVHKVSERTFLDWEGIDNSEEKQSLEMYTSIDFSENENENT